MISRLFLLTFLAIAFISYSVAQNLPSDDDDDVPYNPNSRDFTDRCNEIAQYAGPNSCKAFWMCCSEGHVLSKLNGDRCQTADSENECVLKADSTGIQYSRCKAHNCTTEVTTTTTTTRRPMHAVHSTASSPTIMSVGSIILAAVLSQF